MTKAMLQIHLLSEAIFGGDGEQKGTIDIDIQADEYGLPFISGRTLKGLLRAEAAWFVSQVQGEKQTSYQSALHKLFGKKDDGDIHHSNYDALRFSDGKVADIFYKKIQNNETSSREVLNALTTVRTMTTIDEKTGTVKDGSLRHARVINKGYTFFAPIFIQGLLNDEEKELFEIAVKLLRHVGLMRNRGKGNVACTLTWEEQQVPSKTHIEAETNSYIELTIDTQEPLKINSVRRTSDSTRALNYIPGSVIRGALIHTYLQENNLSPEDLQTDVVFNDESLQFWNGYLSVDGKRGIPFAQHLFQTKEDSKLNKSELDVYNSLDNKEFSKITHLSPVKVNKDVMVLSSNYLKGADVSRTSALHIALNNEHSEDSELYRYEGISPNEQFKAIVKVDAENVQFIEWLKNKNQMTVWLGGARNSGYGRSRLTIKQLDSSPEQIDSYWNDNETNELYIIATSNWIIHDENGLLRSSLDEKWLSKQIGANVSLQNQLVTTETTGGYISHWRAYQPMIESVKAGSVFKYVVDGAINGEAVKKLTETGVGSRRNEGFGRLIMLPTWQYKQLTKVKTNISESLETVKRVYRDESIEQKETNQLLRSILQLRLGEIIGERVNEWYESVYQNRKSISQTQWAKLLQVASDIEKETRISKRPLQEVYDKKWSIFWKDVEERQKNKSRLGYSAIRISDQYISNESLDEFTMNSLRNKTWKVNKPLTDSLKVDHLHYSLQAFILFIKKIIRTRN